MLRELLIVYRAEIVRRIRSRPFLIGLVVGGIGIAMLGRLPGFLNAHVGTEQTRFLLGGAPSLTERASRLLANHYAIVRVQRSTSPPRLSEFDRLHAGVFLALSTDASGLQAVAYSTAPAIVDSRRLSALLLPLDLQVGGHVDASTAMRLSHFKIAVDTVRNAESLEQAQVSRGIAFTLIFFLYLLIVLNSQLTMAGVIEEKTNRIAELLVAAVDPIALLYGKVFAGATLGLLQMIFWMLCGIAAGMTSVRGNPTAAVSATPFNLGGALAGALTPTVTCAFLFFLIVGLLQFSTLFAGVASLISRPEDLGSVNAPMILPIVAALVLAIVALDAPDAPAVVVSSFVPLLSPFTMFARIASGQPPLWQIAAGATIDATALVAIAVLAGRLYRVGMLSYGRPPTLRQIWATIGNRAPSI